MKKKLFFDLENIKKPPQKAAYLRQLGGFFLCSPDCPKQPWTSFQFYKFFYTTISCRISGWNKSSLANNDQDSRYQLEVNNRTRLDCKNKAQIVFVSQAWNFLAKECRFWEKVVLSSHTGSLLICTLISDLKNGVCFKTLENFQVLETLFFLGKKIRVSLENITCYPSDLWVWVIGFKSVSIKWKVQKYANAKFRLHDGILIWLFTWFLPNLIK